MQLVKRKKRSVPTLLTAKQVAGIVCVSTATLCRWRKEGYGPKWVQISKRGIRYKESDVERWLEQEGLLDE